MNNISADVTQSGIYNSVVLASMMTLSALYMLDIITLE